MESTYFDYDWENFFMDDIGLCEKNDRRRTKFDFMSEVYVAFLRKGINKRNAHYILSLKMSDEQIEKYFNTNYDTRHLFRIMVAHLMDLDSEQIAQIEDKSHESCSQALLVQFICGVSADKTAPILKMPVSQENKLSQIGKLSGDEIYTLVSHSYSNGRRKTVHTATQTTTCRSPISTLIFGKKPVVKSTKAMRNAALKSLQTQSSTRKKHFRKAKTLIFMMLLKVPSRQYASLSLNTASPKNAILSPFSKFFSS